MFAGGRHCLALPRSVIGFVSLLFARDTARPGGLHARLYMHFYFYYRAMHYSAKRGLEIACRLSVRLSVCDVDDHIGWKSGKLIARAINPTSSLFVAQRSSTYSQGTWRNFGEKMFVHTYVHNVRWIESTESRDLRWRCGCLLLSAHRTVIFAIAQLSCLTVCSCKCTCNWGWEFHMKAVMINVIYM